mgnify:CR=1 FL=1
MNNVSFKKPELLSLFSTPIVKININRDFTKEETDCVFNLPLQKKIGESKHHSKDFYLFDNFINEGLKDIKIFCEHELKRYLEKIEGVNTDLAGLRITQSWLNKIKPQGFHPTHYHSNSYLSGVLYISCLPNDRINFENRLEGNYNNMVLPIKKPTVWNANVGKVDVEKGDLLLFPSWVPHSVDQNETKNRERISLSFNTFPIGELGESTTGSHLKL